MFNRRVRILLTILVVGTLALIARAAQVQIGQHGQWLSLAEEALRRGQYIRTVRGSILDRKGRVLAEDVPCNDAAVDYRALTDEPDADWVYWTARARLRERAGDAYAAATAERRRSMVRDEVAAVHRDLASMWVALAEASGKSLEDVHETRRAIVRRVDARRDAVRRRAYERALSEHDARGPVSWWRRWLMGISDDPPTPDRFQRETVAEQLQTHVVVSDLDNRAYNRLYKDLPRYPGLLLRPGVTRRYPFGVAGCHVIGNLAAVTAEDLAGDPHRQDALGRYQPHDLIGRSGLERLWEPTLRGRRGRVERAAVARERSDPTEVLSSVEPVPGESARTTIDIRLQRRVQQAFTNVKFRNANRQAGTSEVRLPMPGAAVVIDVQTGGVLAMASYPDYDPNRFDDSYPALVDDAIGRPLMNRATQFALEPGSTMKTIVGLAGITAGLITPEGTIECNGFLKLDGRQYSIGKCWTMHQFGISHHQVPYSDPHPTGWLTYADAIERSCNVYFETLAHGLGHERLGQWQRVFGLGRPVGIGLPEVAGMTADQYDGPRDERRAATWFAGIGQGPVQATPLQMADVAATIARDGVWVRPTLAAEEHLRPKPADERGHRQDLGLSPAGIAAAHAGMDAVVNKRAGTGTSVRRADVRVAGKTGSAQAAPLFEQRRGPDGHVVRRRLTLGADDAPNPDAPWYRGKITDTDGVRKEARAHGWFIGYAPADRPTIAYAVMVEYGWSGGTSAASVVDEVIAACIDEGYLPRPPAPGGDLLSRVDRLGF